MQQEDPDNKVIQDEIAALPKKKAKAEKPKTKKGKTKTAVETGVPSAEEAERVELEGGETLIMPHTHKPKKAKTEQPQPTKEQMTAAEVSSPETRKS